MESEVHEREHDSKVMYMKLRFLQPNFTLTIHGLVNLGLLISFNLDKRYLIDNFENTQLL